MVAAAVAEICHEFGTQALTTHTICKLARISRATFYKLFTSVDECLSSAVEDAYRRLFAPLVAAGLKDPWLERTEAALRVLFERFAAEPLFAELYLVHSFRLSSESTGVGPWRGAADLERLLAAGREEALLGGLEPAETAEEYWASATLAIATKAILSGEADKLPEQAAQLARLIRQSYLGGPRRVGSLGSGSGK